MEARLAHCDVHWIDKLIIINKLIIDLVNRIFVISINPTGYMAPAM
jgi:hypothetical protein